MPNLQINLPSLGQIGYHFTDAIFTCIFMNEEFNILILNSLKFVPQDPIDNDLGNH